MCIYLSVRNAMPMISRPYIPRFYRSPLKHFFTYLLLYDFKLILFQYDTSLSNNFCDTIDQCD